MDLGSGDGTAVFSAASLGWKAIGMELNSTLWLISNLRRLQLPRKTRQNCNLIWGDMFATKSSVKNHLNEANCVMIFGVAPLMPKIATLVQDKCQSGSFVMAHDRFRVPLLKEQHPSAKGNNGIEQKGMHSCNEKITRCLVLTRL